ncbi:MAG: regulatory protein RecX [Lachnospiraceae bacterium]|nr:regulatory protein RecX [Lachnospiraceae bacterium]
MKEGRIVTKIEEFDKKRYKIYLDQEFAFVLYKGELLQYKIYEEQIIGEEIYHKIIEEVLVKRAKKRCLNLLQKKNYTEYKLREKLKEGCYPLDVEDKAIEYIKSFGYVDDYRYACEYMFYHKNTESQKKMEEKLKIKGISSNIIEQALSEAYENDEAEQIEILQAKKILEKKHYDAENMDWKEKQKIYSSLTRKGIRSSIIKKVMIV